MKHTAETFKTDYRGYLPNKGKELRPLTDEECRYFISICMIDTQKVEKEKFNSVDAVQSIRILKSRLVHVEVEPDLKTKMFLGCITKSPGEAIMWAFTLARLAFELKRNPTFDDLFMNMDYFANGIPTETKTKEAWDSQKCYSSAIQSDNLVDRSELWPKWKEAA